MFTDMALCEDLNANFQNHLSRDSIDLGSEIRLRHALGYEQLIDCLLAFSRFRNPSFDGGVLALFWRTAVRLPVAYRGKCTPSPSVRFLSHERSISARRV